MRNQRNLLFVSAAVAAAAMLSANPARAGQTERVSVSSDGEQGNSTSQHSSISADARYVAFESWATNLVPGDTNGHQDVFVHDRQTGETTRVSVSSSGEQGNADSWSPSISADGRYVAFESLAYNLVPGDTNGQCAVFVHDCQTGETTLASVSSSGEQGNGASGHPSISADGRYVAFESRAGNLVPGGTNGELHIFVHDRQAGETTRVSISSSGEQANEYSYLPSISGDGRYVAFFGGASNLVPGDTNNRYDVFVHDRQTGQTTRVSVSSSGEQGNAMSENPSISADGRYVAFESYATNLVPDDTNGHWDIFVHECEPAIPGDLDDDGDVDLSDLAVLLSNYGTPSGMLYEDGDIDGDGDVDLSDLAELLANYGSIRP